MEEVKKLFTVKWADDRAKVASMVAYFCGLRMGEIRGLLLSTIGMDSLKVIHAWSYADKLKSTKTDVERVAVMISMVKDALLELVKKNPWGPGGFVFYGLKPDRPVDQKALERGLYQALEQIGIDEVTPTVNCGQGCLMPISS